ncbi:DUF1223 domain-containing protein [Undibacterium pigrum]|uniref:Secreted protein n=1 Tax=Undibacterium pigrum TaxID=401470 RepID=A0A318JI75_9BURK|nr:DUF1223 domain-containing protein [Undibacterium pigrum]PXX39962.1 hypothetical protein DFR42_10973 [Undibacterium pigrum]
MKALILPGIFACLASSLQAAEICSKSSPAHTVALLELYTSEGCDSCPPADKTISRLYQSTGLNSEQVILLSLHVDYWDHLGWKDVFGKKTFTERQRHLADLAGSRTVYTPEIFIAGKEIRNWRNGMADDIRRINQKPAMASLHLGIEKLADNKLYFNLQGNSRQDARLHFALIEQGLVSKIQAGENRGASLQHDFVAREWGDAYQLAAGKPASFASQLTLPVNAKRKNLSLLAFAQDKQGNILQALSLPICDSLQ